MRRCEECRRKSGKNFEKIEKNKNFILKISRNVYFKMRYRGDFWVFFNAVFWDQQKNLSSIELIMVRYRYYRIRLGIDTIELVSILLPSLILKQWNEWSSVLKNELRPSAQNLDPSLFPKKLIQKQLDDSWNAPVTFLLIYLRVILVLYFFKDYYGWWIAEIISASFDNFLHFWTVLKEKKKPSARWTENTFPRCHSTQIIDSIKWRSPRRES